MNDFDTDVKMKKAIASGAKHRKSGSKSKKCTLPSDNLTIKEKNALNGETHTLILDHAYTIEDLAVFSKQTQRDYLVYLAKNICDTFEDFCEFFKLTEPQMKDYMFSVNFKYKSVNAPAYTAARNVRQEDLPTFDTVTVDGVAIPFNIYKLEFSLETDSLESRQIFCAMLRLMFECRTANAHIAKCLHTSYERFANYIERGLDAYHVERSLYVEVKNGGFSKRNTFLKAKYDTKTEIKKISESYSRKYNDSKFRFLRRVEQIENICKLIMDTDRTEQKDPANTSNELLPVKMDTPVHTSISGTLHLEGTVSDIIQKLSLVLNSDTIVKIDVEF